MNETIKQEVVNLMMYDQFLNVSKQINSLNKINKLLNVDKFCSKLKSALDAFFNHPLGVTLSDMGEIILSMRKIIPEFENILNLYHDLEIDSMKYILYGCLYNYLTKHQANFLNINDIGQLRTEYDNIFKLIQLSKKEFQVESKLCKRIWQWVTTTLTCSGNQIVK